MSTVGPNANQIDNLKLQSLSDLEIDMMSDLYRRLTSSCRKKCIPPKYREPDLTKGESVCIDRCVAKFIDLHKRIGKKIAAIYTQDEETLKKLQKVQQEQLAQK